VRWDEEDSLGEDGYYYKMLRSVSKAKRSFSRGTFSSVVIPTQST